MTSLLSLLFRKIKYDMRRQPCEKYTLMMIHPEIKQSETFLPVNDFLQFGGSILFVELTPIDDLQKNVRLKPKLC